MMQGFPGFPSEVNGIREGHADRIPRANKAFQPAVQLIESDGGGETRAGSNPSLDTIAILKGISAFRRSPFFHYFGPSG